MRGKKKDWFKPKGYLHLTKQLSLNTDRANLMRLVKNPKHVTKHAFFPLLHKKIPQRRFKIVDYGETGRAIRGHNKNGLSTKKLRPIHYATHIDAAIYSYYSQEEIQPRYEKALRDEGGLSSCITAYRKIPTGKGASNKNNIHFAKEVFDHIKERGPCYAMAFDIEDFFSNLDHKLLKKAWCKLLGTKSLPKDHFNIYKSITKYSYILLDDLRISTGGFDEKKIAENRNRYGVNAFFSSPQELRKFVQEGGIRVYKNQRLNPKQKVLRGIPQGLPISAMLANLYLLEFDKLVNSKITNEHSGFYRRYSDDIVVVCNKEDQEEIADFLIESIKDFKLKISPGKTEVCVFDWRDKGQKTLKSTRIIEHDGKKILKKGAPFQYLGFAFFGDKTLVKGTNISKFYRRMREAIRKKAERVKKLKESGKPIDYVVYKRKIRRIYSHHGESGRRLPKQFFRLEPDLLKGRYKTIYYDSTRRYRGNYLSYIYRAAKVMNEPAIRKQLKRHEKVLERELQKIEQILYGQL